MKSAVLALAKRGIELHFVGVRNPQQAEIEEAVDVASKQEAVGHLIVRSSVVRADVRCLQSSTLDVSGYGAFTVGGDESLAKRLLSLPRDDLVSPALFSGVGLDCFQLPAERPAAVEQVRPASAGGCR